MALNGYCNKAFHPGEVKLIVKRAVRKLVKLDFDAIAVRGVSGLAIGPIIAYFLSKKLIVVRKTKACHSDCNVELPLGIKKYIIVDDFVASGKTVKTILTEIKNADDRLVCIGLYTWKNAGDKTTEGLDQLNTQGDTRCLKSFVWKTR